MKGQRLLGIGLLALIVLGRPSSGDVVHRLGAGATYWVSIKEIPENKDWERSQVGYLLSYQYQPALFGLELAMDILPDRFGENTYSPHVMVFVGRGFFVAGGIGLAYADSSFADQPFYLVKGGVNWELLPNLYVELSAQYRFREWADLEDEKKDFDTDTVFLGGAVRLGF